MKLRALELEQFRKFDRPIRIAGMGDGLNLVVGPNEMGKSTLFAALEAVLFERHRSQAQSVKSLQPVGHDGASPRVTLEFELRGQPYRIEKRFLRRPAAELALPDGRHLHGDVAEEALESLLAGGSHGRAASEALGVFGLLWVGQGRSFALPEVAAARGTLQSALDAEVGEVLGGDHGGALMERLDEALHELIYRRGQPKGRYREATEALAELQNDIRRLEQERKELEQDLTELEEAQVEYDRLRTDQRARHAEQEHGELLALCDLLKVRGAEVREAEAALAAARHALPQGQAEQERRQALQAALLAAEHDTEVATTSEAALAREVAEAERIASDQAGEVDRLQTTLDAAEDRQRGLQRLVQAIRQRDDARAALRAAASEVRFELEAQALERVRIDGRPPGEAARSLRIVDPLTVDITDVGRILVRPMVADRRRLQSGLKDAEGRIARELEALGLRRPTPQARQLEFELAAEPWLAGSVAAPEPGGDPSTWPEAAAVATALAEAERQVDALAAQLRAARRDLDLALETRHGKRAAHGQASERHTEALRRVGQLRAELSEAEKSTPEADLARGIAQLYDQLALAEARMRQLRAQAPEESLQDLERRIAELRQTLDANHAALRQGELAIERLRARIQALAGGGLDERLAVARRRFDELERECDKYRSEVEVVELLLRVLRDAEREAKERYVGPLVHRIRPYLEALFPGADLEMDEAFRITSVARQSRPELFERLSDGTREQIAILTRLGFAELLADQGRPAVVILDDALVFSDDQRIEGMFQILARAAEKFQILLLTCRERVFRDLPAQRLRLEQVQTAGAY